MKDGEGSEGSNALFLAKMPKTNQALSIFYHCINFKGCNPIGSPSSYKNVTLTAHVFKLAHDPMP
jgi:hypothetical protein